MRREWYVLYCRGWEREWHANVTYFCVGVVCSFLVFFISKVWQTNRHTNIGDAQTCSASKNYNFEKVKTFSKVSDRGRFVRGLKKLKKCIAYSCSKLLNSHKNDVFFEKILCPGGPLLADLTPFGIFFQKSASAKMKPLYSLNFRPKIRTSRKAVRTCRVSSEQ